MERTTAGEGEVRVHLMAGAITREFIVIEDEFIAGVSCRFWRARFGGEEEPDRWVPVVSERERDRGTGSGGGLVGPRVASSTGPKRCPWPLFHFFYFVSSFSFSVFLK
jgi:hypothetical protein